MKPILIRLHMEFQYDSRERPPLRGYISCHAGSRTVYASVDHISAIIISAVIGKFRALYLIVRPNGADHQRGKDPPRQKLVRSGS
jgi:hypothetical protein